MKTKKILALVLLAAVVTIASAGAVGYLVEHKGIELNQKPPSDINYDYQ